MTEQDTFDQLRRTPKPDVMRLYDIWWITSSAAWSVDMANAFLAPHGWSFQSHDLCPITSEVQPGPN